jgi:hypothetical protein
MKRPLLASATIVVGALYFGALEPADAALATLGPDNATEGLTYTLEMNATAGNKTTSFALTITGENVSVSTRAVAGPSRPSPSHLQAMSPSPPCHRHAYIR